MGKSQKQRIAESIQREELANWLRRIIKQANRIKLNKNELKHSYVDWCNTTEKTINSLTELRDKMVNTNTIANAASGVATFAEIFGCVLSVAGAIADKRDLMEVGEKITKGGNITNLGTSAIKNIYLKDLCNAATRNCQRNQECSRSFERIRYSYFQALEAVKRELRTAEANGSLPLLLETAQREQIDFLGDLGIDDVTKSKLRTNLRQMCRSNSKKIKATTENVRTQEVCKVFASEIRRLLYEFKELIYEDDSLFSIFSQETKKFIGDNVANLLPYVDTAESWLGQCSGVDLLRGGASLYQMSSAFSSTTASRTEIGLMSGVRMASSIVDFMKLIKDIDNGSISRESEELTERIEEMRETRTKIIKAMRENFGWEPPPSVEKATKEDFGWEELSSAKAIDYPRISERFS